MKINLAVYTAQEGYSWQPGTVFSAEELAEFKKSIGKFPSPDTSDFPFGGVFLLSDHVVFYRYHVAKKIDFRGRDALYCVLGAVSRDDAAKIAPASLFASPEFAGPMKPFPTALELPEADPSTVPEWLKNLDKTTLDVRITGSAENPNYAVVQEPVEVPQPLADMEKTTDGGTEVAPAGESGGDAVASAGESEAAPSGDAGPASPAGDSSVGKVLADPGGVVHLDRLQLSVSKPPKNLPLWVIAGVVALAMLIVGLSAWGIVYCLKRCSNDVADAGGTGETGGTGEVARVTQVTNATAVSQVSVATVSPAASPRPATANVPAATVPTNVLASSANPKLPPAQNKSSEATPKKNGQRK